jgi:hypothetical protein
MSQRDWRTDFAIAGGLGAVVTMCVWVFTLLAIRPIPGNIHHSGKGHPAQQEQAQSPANHQPIAAPENQSTAKKEAECGNDNQNYYDCVIQLRTARATERQANAAKGANWIGAAALLFAALAAAGGVFAAIATSGTIRTMQDIARRELRAYIATAPDALTGLNPNEPVHFQFAVINDGTTPAYRVTQECVLDILNYLLPQGFQSPA